MSLAEKKDCSKGLFPFSFTTARDQKPSSPPPHTNVVTKLSSVFDSHNIINNNSIIILSDKKRLLNHTDTNDAWPKGTTRDLDYTIHTI